NSHTDEDSLDSSNVPAYGFGAITANCSPSGIVQLNLPPNLINTLWEFEMFHELGHHLLFTVCQEEALPPTESFRDISWAGECLVLPDPSMVRKSDNPDDFLCINGDIDMCNAARTCHEDFATAYSYYVYRPAYFRAAAQDNPILLEKYETLRDNYFNGEEFFRPWDKFDEFEYYLKTYNYSQGMQKFFEFMVENTDEHFDIWAETSFRQLLSQTYLISSLVSSRDERMAIYREAIFGLEEFIALYEEHELFSRYAPYIFATLAEFYDSVGEQEASDEIMLHMIAEYEDLLADELYIGLYFDIALIYKNLIRDYGKAIDYYELHLEVNNTAYFQTLIADAYLEWAVYLDNDEALLIQAIVAYQVVLDDYDAPRDQGHQAKALYYMGICYERLGDVCSAVDYYNRVLEEYAEPTGNYWINYYLEHAQERLSELEGIPELSECAL
ncbi:tol-pal system YbgF family protein, partial [Candidatus Margulisiibacteriota bacterium]